MVTFNWKTVIVIPGVVTAAHAVAHYLLNMYVMNILNPILISLVVYFVYALLRKNMRRVGMRMSKTELKREMRQDTLYCWIVAGLHFLAHVFASSLTGLPIIDNTVVGIAGTVVLVSVFVLEVFF